MMNPPNDGTVIQAGKTWNIGRNGDGMIVLRSAGECHPEFFNGMDLREFCHWINSKL